MFDFENEAEQQLLLSKGLMIEDYNKTEDELVRKISPEGLNVLREKLKYPKYKKQFLTLLKEELSGFPEEIQKGVLFDLHMQLVNG